VIDGAGHEDTGDNDNSILTIGQSDQAHEHRRNTPDDPYPA